MGYECNSLMGDSVRLEYMDEYYFICFQEKWKGAWKGSDEKNFRNRLGALMHNCSSSEAGNIVQSDGIEEQHADEFGSF